jgi:hypothetical protein
VFESGDVAAHGGIFDGEQETSASTHYPASHPWAGFASVTLTRDWMGASNGGWWQIQLERATLIPIVVYNDADALGDNNQMVWQLASSSCSVTQY